MTDIKLVTIPSVEHKTGDSDIRVPERIKIPLRSQLLEMMFKFFIN